MQATQLSNITAGNDKASMDGELEHQPQMLHSLNGVLKVQVQMLLGYLGRAGQPMIIVPWDITRFHIIIALSSHISKSEGKGAP